MADPEKKKKKPSFAARMVARGREAKHLGKTLKDEPRSFPAAVLDLMRRSFRIVWRARGGGLYACGFVVTFFYLEIQMFFGDIFAAESFGSFFAEQASEILFRYIGESIRNTISAFMWPVYIIEIKPPWGIGLLVGMYLVFANFVKQPLEKWLFDGESPGTGPTK